MMSMKRSALVLALTMIATVAHAQTWQLDWSDEFPPGAKIDTTKWRWETGGGGWGNQELETYTSSPLNSIITGSSGQGFLNIVGRRDTKGNYTSARLASIPGWTYGRMEVRAWVPGGRGTWPAIWMLPQTNSYGNGGWPDNGEMDIMEEVGYEGNVSHATVHNHSYNGELGNQITNSIAVPKMTAGFHVFAMEWRPTQVDFFVDGTGYLTYHRNGANWEAWPYDKGFQFRLNLAIGGTWGGAQGVDTTIWPRIFYIDYVRVSKAVSTRYGTTNAVPGKIYATQYDNGGAGFAYNDNTPSTSGSHPRKDGVGLGVSPSEGTYIGWISTDDWWNYTVPVAAPGKYALYARVASPNSGEKFYLEVDDTKASIPITVPNTGDWNKFATVSLGNVSLTQGAHTFRIVCLTGGFNLGNLASAKVAGP